MAIDTSGGTERDGIRCADDVRDEYLEDLKELLAWSEAEPQDGQERSSEDEDGDAEDGDEDEDQGGTER